MKDFKFESVGEFLEWLHQQREAGTEFPTIGCVGFHIYMCKLVGGGVECNLWHGTGFKEADMKLQEEKPGVLTVAVVPRGEISIDYINRKPFLRTAKLDDVRNAFPNGRNIDRIVDELSAHNGE